MQWARFEWGCACLPTQRQLNVDMKEMMPSEQLRFRSTGTATAAPHPRMLRPESLRGITTGRGLSGLSTHHVRVWGAQ